MQASTLPRKRLPAAWAVLVVALALVFVLVSAVGLIAWNSYDDAMERSRARVASAAQVVATHVEWLTAASLLLMDETDHVIGDDVTTLLSGARTGTGAAPEAHAAGRELLAGGHGGPGGLLRRGAAVPRLTKAWASPWRRSRASGPGMSPPW